MSLISALSISLDSTFKLFSNVVLIKVPYLRKVLRIRDVYPGSVFFISDPGSMGKKIPDPHQSIEVF
jgi:hypothetical protein